jgi:hypothetical protein
MNDLKDRIISGSHTVLIAAIAAITKGPILEMGCGNHSTNVLHELCLPTKRRLVSLETNSAWLDKLSHLKSDFHQLLLVSDWGSFSLIDEVEWSVVLVDHAPGERRKDDIIRLKDNAEYIVVHDTESPCYDLVAAFAQFRCKYEYKVLGTEACALSDRHDLSFLGDVYGHN